MNIKNFLYIPYYILKTPPKNFVENIKYLSKKTNKAFAIIVLDIFKCSIVHSTSFMDYFLLRFFDKSEEERMEYAAKALKERGINDVDFIFLGEGKAEKELKEFKIKNDLNNVFFYDRVPMDMTSEIVNISDISVVPFKNIPILNTNSPNKLFDSLAAGKPIIVNSNGWTKVMVEENNCGAYVNPEIPSELAEMILDWKAKPEILKQMGLNSRQLAETTYDESILTKKFAGIIKGLDLKK